MEIIVDTALIILFIVMLALIFVIVFLAYFYIQPARSSPAKFFIEAKRKKRPVCIMDNGSTWYITTGISHDEAGGYIEDKNGGLILVSPNSIKYSMGVKIGVGEAHRNILVDPKVIKLINEVRKSGGEATKTREIIEEIEKEARKEELKIEEKKKDETKKQETGESEETTDFEIQV